MYSIIIVVHVVISLFLIAVILLQAGKGGGLADTFGGSQMQNLFGTKSTTVLTRLTAVCAIGFIATCITLAVMSSHQARSIVDNVRIPQAATPTSQTETAAPQDQTAIPQTTTSQTDITASQDEIAIPQAQVPPVEPAPVPQGGANEVK